MDWGIAFARLGVFRRTDQESKQRARVRAVVFGRHAFGLPCGNRPLVAPANPPDLSDRAKDLLDSANVANRREVSERVPSAPPASQSGRCPIGRTARPKGNGGSQIRGEARDGVGTAPPRGAPERLEFLA